jgi:hypothetical protein
LWGGADAVSRSYGHLKPPLKTVKNRGNALLMIDSSLESSEKQKYVIEKSLAELLFELFDFEVRSLPLLLYRCILI